MFRSVLFETFTFLPFFCFKENYFLADEMIADPVCAAKEGFQLGKFNKGKNIQ